MILRQPLPLSLRVLASLAYCTSSYPTSADRQAAEMGRPVGAGQGGLVGSPAPVDHRSPRCASTVGLQGSAASWPSSPRPHWLRRLQQRRTAQAGGGGPRAQCPPPALAASALTAGPEHPAQESAFTTHQPGGVGGSLSLPKTPQQRGAHKLPGTRLAHPTALAQLFVLLLFFFKSPSVCRAGKDGGAHFFAAPGARIRPESPQRPRSLRRGGLGVARG